jgi:hypothetical protein
MAQPLSGHLWNAAILAVSVAIAVAAERLTASPRGVPAPAARGAGTDISSFVAPIRFDSMVPSFRIPVRIDPFGPSASTDDPAVAYVPATRTVRTSSDATGRVLTAILVADDRRVAVIDDVAVKVGDVLPDGARVSAIQPTKVFLVDRNGQFHTLTLTNRGQ